jgi:hypothetical protein
VTTLLSRWTLGVISLLCLYTPLGRTQPPAVSPAGVRSNHFRDLTKIRSGSVLRRRSREAPTVDMRSENIRSRDRELNHHYSRLAKLDVIAAVADANQNQRLADETERVRRKELKRHRLRMSALRKEAIQDYYRGSRL